jgi:hypothetical protein
MGGMGHATPRHAKDVEATPGADATLLAQVQAAAAGAGTEDERLEQIRDLLDAADAAASAPCGAELHSWDVFRSGQVDPYWMRCHLVGPHDEHENSETGATWREPR